ncbi:MAG: hypothetical protein ABUL49_01860 [bacterium]
MESSPIPMSASFNGQVRQLVLALDKLQPGELAHSDRTSVYSVACGELLALTDLELLQLRCAAQLCGVARKIRHVVCGDAKEALGAEEWLKVAQTNLEVAPVAPPPAWFSGTVLLMDAPYVVESEAVPLSAQIIACCEAFDAGCKDHSREEAFELIRRQPWSPTVIQALGTVLLLVNPVPLSDF